MLQLVAQRLRDRGIPDERIIHLNFDSLEWASIASAQALHAHLASTLPSAGRVYVLLDEIQEVSEWERLVNSLLSEGRADLYITGSNSRLLSGELATYIAGRYVSIEVWPLSFGEYLKFDAAYSKRDDGRTGEKFTRFLRYGGFPGVHPFARQGMKVSRIEPGPSCRASLGRAGSGRCASESVRCR